MHVTIARGLQNCLDLLLKHCSPFLDKCSLKLGYDPACSGVFNRKPTETKCWPSNHLDKLLIVGHCAGETGIVFGVHAGAPHHIASVRYSQKPIRPDMMRSWMSKTTSTAQTCAAASRMTHGGTHANVALALFFVLWHHWLESAVECIFIW